MSKRIYVGNLPWSVAKTEFEKLFSPFGEIEEALVIANKYAGRSVDLVLSHIKMMQMLTKLWKR